jgi:molybdopterin converting factor small subunit
VAIRCANGFVFRGAKDDNGHMQIRIEFFGIPRSRAGAAECTLTVLGQDEVTLAEAIQLLGERFPALRDECLAADRPAPGYALNLNGQRFLREPQTLLQHNDCLLLLSADAGG